MPDSNITFTPNLHLSKLPANYRVWAQIMNDNLTMLDGAVSGFIIYDNWRGAWTNSTHYAVGDTVIDLSNARVWSAQVDHVSAQIPTTFTQDQEAHPGYWLQANAPATARGAWTGPGTSYNVNDFVLAGGTKYAICLLQHVSGLVFDDDVALGRWSVLFDVSAGGGAATISPTPPVSPAPNQLWWNSDLGQLFIYYNDGNSAQWVPATPSGMGMIVPGPSVPILQNSIACDWMIGTEEDRQAQILEGGIWTSLVYGCLGVSRSFGAETDSVIPDNAPNFALFATAHNTGSNNAVVGALIEGVALTATGSTFGSNIIARNGNVNGAKLVGLEIDVSYSAGTTGSGTGGGLFINFFGANAGPGIQMGTVFGGSGTNGIQIDGTWTGGMLGGTGAFDTGINLAFATFASGWAINLPNNNQIRFTPVGATSAGIVLDNTDVFHLHAPGLLALHQSSIYSQSTDNITAQFISSSVSNFSLIRAAAANGNLADFGVDLNGGIYIRASKDIAAGVAALTVTDNNGSGVLLAVDGTGGLASGSYVRTASSTLATLPAAATAAIGARHFITDATVTHTAGVGTIAAGGGANKVPVYSDGTNWRIG